MIKCGKCAKGAILGESCYACGWSPEMERERRISEHMRDHEGRPTHIKFPVPKQLSLLDERNLKALREMA